MKRREITMTVGDADRRIVYQLVLDGVPFNLAGIVGGIVCKMRDITTGAVAHTVATVTADPDQTTKTGYCTTTFSATQLASAATYDLEWVVTDGTVVTTFPSDGDERPRMNVRA